MATPVQHSLKYLRGKGWNVTISSWWDSFGKKRKDLWGFADLAGYHEDIIGTTYFQITTISNISARKKKILKNKYAKGLLVSGNRIVIHGWEGRGSKKKLKEIIITLENFRDEG
jgi:hypothetical protein